LLGYERAKEILLEEFNRRKVDDIHWSTVNDAFQNGRSAVISTTQLKERYFPVVVNDNEFFEPTVFEWEDPSTIPVRDWIYGKHLIRRHVSMTIASGAVGKTSFKIVEALALGTGVRYSDKTCHSVYEFGCSTSKTYMTELRRRVSAAMIYYNIKLSGVLRKTHFSAVRTVFDFLTQQRH
jgi:hypothetical protein